MSPATHSLRRSWRLLPLVAAAITAPLSGSAQSLDDVQTAAPTTRAGRLVGSLALDGRLNEVAWAAAPVIASFTQRDPQEGEPVSERTEVRILYDAGALYVGALLRDRSAISSRLGRRDASFQDSDLFAIAFDSYHDHLTAFRFAVNPSGVKRDEVISGGGFSGGFSGGLSGGGGGFGGGGGDATWDPVWDVATMVTDSGWVVEMRIPFSQLRFSSADVQTWGLQIERRIARTQELASFAFSPKTQRGGVPAYGHLTGLQGIVAQSRLEVLPYAFARGDYRVVPQSPAVVFTNPYRTGADISRSMGGDLKFRLSSNITLDATINPDFGQVEVDPAVVNLSAFETRYEERRPFFVEGASIFRFGSGGMMNGGTQTLYSRRIGRSPQVGVPSTAVYSDVPGAATILGAAKLTGRTDGGWSFGILDAVTARETAPYVDAAQIEADAVVEPLTNYFAGRVRRDLRGGRTRVGGIVTAVHRALDDATLASRLRDAAYVSGVDFNQEWADRIWSMSASLASSYISGSTPVMVRAQQSSARYYQRPDAGHLAVDTMATSLTGYSGSVSIGKRAGKITGSGSLSAVSAGYETNDLGFQTTADRISTFANLAYAHTQPGQLLREWRMDANSSFSANYDGDPVQRRTSGSFNFSLMNYWSGSIDLARGGGTLNDRLTRGGPLTRDPNTLSIDGRLRTDPRRGYTVSSDVGFDRDAAGGRNNSVKLSLGWRPAENWELRLGPEIKWGQSMAQYVTSITDSVATATFGRRYIFADLTQTEVGISTRVNVTFTPKVSLEIFAQPLIAGGDYGALKELRTPRSFDFSTYGTDVGTITEAGGTYTIDPDGAGLAQSFDVGNRDFTALELRGNAVLRWEFHAGSTLYLVWQQHRSAELDAFGADAQRAGRFDLGRDARGLVDIRPENVFMVKVSYWLNP